MYRLEILDPNNYNLGVSDRAPGAADGLLGAVVEPLLAGEVDPDEVGTGPDRESHLQGLQNLSWPQL